MEPIQEDKVKDTVSTPSNYCLGSRLVNAASRALLIFDWGRLKAEGRKSNRNDGPSVPYSGLLSEGPVQEMKSALLKPREIRSNQLGDRSWKKGQPVGLTKTLFLGLPFKIN